MLPMLLSSARLLTGLARRLLDPPPLSPLQSRLRDASTDRAGEQTSHVPRHLLIDLGLMDAASGGQAALDEGPNPSSPKP